MSQRGEKRRVPSEKGRRAEPKEYRKVMAHNEVPVWIGRDSIEGSCGTEENKGEREKATTPAAGRCATRRRMSAWQVGRHARHAGPCHFRKPEEDDRVW